jgi:hypothetical protein
MIFFILKRKCYEINIFLSHELVCLCGPEEVEPIWLELLSNRDYFVSQFPANSFILTNCLTSFVNIADSNDLFPM